MDWIQKTEAWVENFQKLTRAKAQISEILLLIWMIKIVYKEMYL